jgi:7,8-dihydropterin-6-yl-methyl-4-(beta-D-ribofuranosyl)aminobenzene 5'-phosphate synthase
MQPNVHLTVLVENSVHTRTLRAEHGLAILIESHGRRVLFDTGQTDLVLANAARLGHSLENLDAIVLSHGHDDHTGGLAAVCRQSPQARVFLHPAATAPKFSGNAAGPPRAIGLPVAGQQALATAGENVLFTPTHREVIEGVFVTGEIPRRTDYEDVGGRFFLDAAGQQPDPLWDDQALYFPTAEGLVVVLGCAHAGVVNTLLQIEALTGAERIHAVIGGLHLLNATPARLAATVEALRRRQVVLLVPAHCTGAAATARLWTEFPGNCRAVGAGTTLLFPV